MDRRFESSEEQLTVHTDGEACFEKAVTERPGFDRLLCELSTHFLNLPAAELDREITYGLQRLAECLDGRQSTLFELSEDATHIRATHTWTAAASERAEPVTLDDVPWVVAKLHRGEIVRLMPGCEMPGKTGGTKKESFRHDMQSAVIIPLAVFGFTTRAIALVARRTESVWPTGVIQQVRLLGEIFAGALSRRQAYELFQAASFQLSLLQASLRQDQPSPLTAVTGADNVVGMIGQSDVLRAVRFRLAQVAPSDTTVLLLGETGVGKELMACAVHQQSRRSTSPFVTVNCAALSATLIESELFGHEKGAFTGAMARRVGRFEAAHGGTLFLDEIGDLPLELQAKLLRVLQQGEFERVGSSRTFRVDVRVIAATNRDLEADMRGGRFRSDLYYRLAVFPITVPALRERREDIPLLVRYFVRQCAQHAGKVISAVPTRVMEALQAYAWPGNVRELRNVIERAVINSQGPTLCLMDQLPPSIEPKIECQAVRPLAAAEAAHILRALEVKQWKIEGHTGAAAALGLPASTLRKRMRKLGIRRPTGG